LQTTCKISLYDLLPNTKLSELPKIQKEKEIKSIIGLLEMNYNRKYSNEKIIMFIRMMEKDGYGLQRIKDCFENLIRTHVYPDFNYANLTNYSRDLYTQFDVIKSGRGYNEFIRCETHNGNIYYWDKKYGELPVILKPAPIQKSKHVYFYDKEAKNISCWDETYAGKCPYPNVNEKEISELSNKELNERLKCKYYSEQTNHFLKGFLKRYTKII